MNIIFLSKKHSHNNKHCTLPHYLWCFCLTFRIVHAFKSLYYSVLFIWKYQLCSTLHMTYTWWNSFVDVWEQLFVLPTAGIKCIIDGDSWLSNKLLPMCSAKPWQRCYHLGCSLCELQIYSNCSCAHWQVRTEIFIHLELLNYFL